MKTSRATFEAAVDWAVGELRDTVDVFTDAATAEDVILTLHDAYALACETNGGMDRHLVRWGVKALLRLGRFPELDRRLEEPKLITLPWLPDERTGRGRPSSLPTDAAVAFTVAAVQARFDLTRFRNDEPGSEGDTQADADGDVVAGIGTSGLDSVRVDGRSACDAVAKAAEALDLGPKSYSRVKAIVLSSAPEIVEATTQGETYGRDGAS